MDVYHLNQIPSEAQIKKFFRRTLFGTNIYCPICKRRQVSAHEDRYWCSKCRRWFSLLSDTWLANMKLPLQQFWLVLWCWTTQIPVKQTMALSELSEKAVRHWYEAFRTHLPFEPELLEAIVQLDEAYFGGRMGYALLMGKQVGTRKLAYHVLPHSSPAKEDAWAFLQTYVRPETTLQTDGGGIYKQIDQWWPVNHKYELHKHWEFVLTSEIEGMFGNLRTFIRRMYHHVTPEKLPEVVCEFCFRFSHPEMFKNPRYYLQNTLSLAPTG